MIVSMVKNHFDQAGGPVHRRYKLQREAERIMTDAIQSLKPIFGMK